MNKIIDSKKIIQNPKDGTQIVDFLHRSYATGMNILPFENFGYVTDQMQMRSDIFAKVYAISEEDEWDILKYNGISNPFILKEGDILAIPNFRALSNSKYTEERRSQENTKSIGSKEEIRNQVKELINFQDRVNIDSTTFNDFKKKYSNLKELKRQQDFNTLRNDNSVNVSGSGSDIGLPPNFNTTGRDEYQISENGEVTLGTSVAKNPDDCERKTFTKAELINSLLKNRRTLR